MMKKNNITRKTSLLLVAIFIITTCLVTITPIEVNADIGAYIKEVGDVGAGITNAQLGKDKSGNIYLVGNLNKYSGGLGGYTYNESTNTITERAMPVAFNSIKFQLSRAYTFEVGNAFGTAGNGIYPYYSSHLIVNWTNGTYAVNSTSPYAGFYRETVGDSTYGYLFRAAWCYGNNADYMYSCPGRVTTSLSSSNGSLTLIGGGPTWYQKPDGNIGVLWLNERYIETTLWGGSTTVSQDLYDSFKMITKRPTDGAFICIGSRFSSPIAYGIIQIGLPSGTRFNWRYSSTDYITDLVYLNDGTAILYNSTKWQLLLADNTLGAYGDFGGRTIVGGVSLNNGKGAVFTDSNGNLCKLIVNDPPTVTITAPASSRVFSAVTGYNAVTIQGTVTDSVLGDKNYIKYNVDGGTTAYLAITAGKSGNDGYDYITSNGTARYFTTEAINLSAIAEGTHALNIVATDDHGGTTTATIPFKIDKTSPVLGTINISTSDSSFEITGIATDNQGLSDKPYQYTVSTKTPSGWTNTLFRQEQLMPNTYYSVKFEAKDIVGNIAQSTKAVYTKASTPSILVSNPTSFTLDLTISDNNPTTTQYQIIANSSQYVTAEGGLTASPSWVTLSQKKISVKNLLPSTNYTFKVKAINGDGFETALSSPATGTTLVAPPAAPINIISTATNNSITVVWDPVAGSTGYQIEADGRIIDVGTYNSYVHINLVQFTQHTYRIRAKNAGGFGAWSEQISKYTQQDNPNTPFNIDAAANNTSIIVTWKPIPGATAYDIEVDGVVVNNYSSTNYVHSGLIPGTMLRTL